jgi:hypothetical protein
MTHSGAQQLQQQPARQQQQQRSDPVPSQEQVSPIGVSILGALRSCLYTLISGMLPWQRLHGTLALTPGQMQAQLCGQRG